MDWHTGYLRQAISDYTIFKVLESVPDTPLCHRLHYLQMATEKLAKGFLTPPNGGAFEYTHKVFKAFLSVALSNQAIRSQVGMTNQYAAYRSYLREMTPLAETIQNLSPEGDDHPNPEYPWQDTQGNVISPLDYPFAGLDTRGNPKMQKLLYFVEACLEIARQELQPIP